MQTAPPRERGLETVSKSGSTDFITRSQRPFQALTEQLVESYGRMLPPDYAWLEGQGVPELAIHMYPGPVGLLDEMTFLMPIWSDGALSDPLGAVAWLRRDPAKFWILDAGDDVLGLGQRFLIDAADQRGSLAVASTPLEWLKRYGACFCPLRVWGL